MIIKLQDPGAQRPCSPLPAGLVQQWEMEGLDSLSGQQPAPSAVLALRSPSYTKYGLSGPPCSPLGLHAAASSPSLADHSCQSQQHQLLASLVRLDRVWTASAALLPHAPCPCCVPPCAGISHHLCGPPLLVSEPLHHSGDQQGEQGSLYLWLEAAVEQELSRARSGHVLDLLADLG